AGAHPAARDLAPAAGVRGARQARRVATEEPGAEHRADDDATPARYPPAGTEEGGTRAQPRAQARALSGLRGPSGPAAPAVAVKIGFRGAAAGRQGRVEPVARRICLSRLPAAAA